MSHSKLILFALPATYLAYDGKNEFYRKKHDEHKLLIKKNLGERIFKRLDAPIHLVLGGFHLFRKSRRFIDQIVNAFKTFKVEKAAPCHCSGDMAIAQFQEVYQERFCNIGTGTILTLDQ